MEFSSWQWCWFLVPLDFDFGTNLLWELEPFPMVGHWRLWARNLRAAADGRLCSYSRKVLKIDTVLPLNEIHTLCAAAGASLSEASVASGSPSHGFPKLNVWFGMVPSVHPPPPPLLSIPSPSRFSSSLPLSLLLWKEAQRFLLASDMCS